MSHNRSNQRLTSDRERSTDNQGVSRRGFLTVAGTTAVALPGVFSESAAAAQGSSPDSLGYGSQSYGADGYGSVETAE
jgi:hypothetical protein